MKKLTKFLLVSLLGVMILLTNKIGTAAAGGNHGGFSFNYNVGTTVTNYHAYVVASEVWCSSPQPAGTVILGIWWVRDLGNVSGTGTINCPALTCPTRSSDLGILFFADASDVGGDGSTAVFTHPVADIQLFDPRRYPIGAFVGIIEPDNSGITLYAGPQFTPFSWDLSPYLY